MRLDVKRELPAGEDTIVIYRDASHRVRWHRKARNGRIVADSGQGYVTVWGALRAARRSNPDA